MTPSAPAALARACLISGVTVTALSFAALLSILGFYFADSVPHASLYWIALWGFPAGFVLMCLHMVLNLKRRRGH
ncbi:hypothetical protein [Nesterenkonia sphaerica]|uniref:Uncharacterized protein n=1 Tax=Nesterenkonia sphaerica TaxID=1804988 RepID=A0A5R9A6A5_9MICC|nr:hypothetical protein [Nesterenkonia sphaerica]TLP74060.1 hypothetical protein FEF27_09920 [Nesterenkonia sphaerica]